jgi:arylsulfatase A-like enzyme
VHRAVIAQQRTIRRSRWKLTVDEAGEHELYDLASDPEETHNLLYEAPGHLPGPALAAARALWTRLQAWQRATGDTAHLLPPVRLADDAGEHTNVGAGGDADVGENRASPGASGPPGAHPPR